MRVPLIFIATMNGASENFGIMLSRCKPLVAISNVPQGVVLGKHCQQNQTDARFDECVQVVR